MSIYPFGHTALRTFWEGERDIYLRKPEYFMTVARERSITKAAKILYVSEYPSHIFRSISPSWKRKITLSFWTAQSALLSWQKPVLRFAAISRRYQCYITQSTCEFLGKPDDCFELKAFRDFRDGYLKSCTDGPALIEEYYKTAPAIVQRITFSHSRNDIFQRIWEQYLQPCLDDLLHSRWEDCKNRYIGMVHALQLEFLPNGNILQPSEFDKQNQ